MTLTLLELLLAVSLGAVIGAWAAWERCIRHERAPIQFTVTPEVLSQLNSAMVTAWLEQNGLVWQPKGIEDVMARSKK